MKLFLLTLVLVAIAIAGFAVKMFFTRDGQFSKSCSSVDTGHHGKREGCVCSGNGDDRSCENYEKHHGNG